jgi:hypothetical protein
MGFSYRCWRLAVGAALFLAAPPEAFAQQVEPQRARVLAQAPAFASFNLAEREAYRRVADTFIATAVAGDSAKLTGMISPSIAAKTGPEAVARYLADPVLPFFAQFKEVGKSITVTQTDGAPGFTFYMYMVSKQDALRPFVVQVIEEGSVKVVANVLVDNFVEGRHCAFEAGGWKCPDFR